MDRVPTALSIAGSDCSGGAGLQADLKTFADHGVYGMAVVTAVTVQNTRGVTAVHEVPPAVVAAQIRAVLEDIPPGAVKIGMLGTEAVIEAVLEALEGYPGPVVVDPVMVATSGDPLLRPEAEQALRERLVPRATVVTPNLPEEARLLGGEPRQAWVDRVGVALLAKDGHGREAVVVDRLHAPGAAPVTVAHPRIATRNTHGTGCTLSSALAARLARGEALDEAADGAIRYVARLVERSAGHALGGGHGPLLHGPSGE